MSDDVGSNDPSLPPAVLERLRCPRCGLRPRMVRGSLACAAGHSIPRSNGYLDCSGQPEDKVTARTFASFGYEWTRFDRLKPEAQLVWRRWFADVPFESLRAGIGLDAGCGKGQYSRLCAPYLDWIVALDGSVAVEAAARNLAEVPNATVVRADLRHAPFADGSFDFIFCVGVLHHLADPQRGVRSLARLLSPGGYLLIYVYSRPDRPGVRSLGLSVASLLRKVTVRLPLPLLRSLSVPIAALLWVTLIVPGRIGDRLDFEPLSRLPLSMFRRIPFRDLAQGTFDLLAAPLERRFVRYEVESLLRTAGLEPVVLREDAGWIALARGARLEGSH